MKTTDLKFTVTPQPPLFIHKGMEYYLVTFEAVPGVESTTLCDPKDALDANGHVPAVIRGIEALEILRNHVSEEDGWVALYDCRENMNSTVGYFNAVPLSEDGLCFYHVDHGAGPHSHPALCWRKVGS